MLGSLLAAGLLQAQDPDFQADTVNLLAGRAAVLAPGQRPLSLDSSVLQLWRGHSLAEVLSAHSEVFIKHYGPGSLASSSMRGGGASHTALIWNGFNLQSPMNGQQDLSLLPAFFFDEVQVQQGGAASLYGSGAVGGALHLGSRPRYGQRQRLALSLLGGSFGRWQASADLSLGRARRFSRTRAFALGAENDFALPGGTPQPHARFRQQALMQENAFRIGRRQQLRFWLWAQAAQRQLPPTLSGGPSEAEQSDASLRLAADWQREGQRLSLKARSAFLGESLLYQDPRADLYSPNRSQGWIQEAEMSLRIAPRHRLHAGLNHSWQAARAEGYGEGSIGQQQAALFVSWAFRDPGGRWQAAASLRQGWARGLSVPLTPSASFRGQLRPWLSVRGQAGRSFRLPTFNDLYWRPGGNPALEAERGWQQELGLEALKAGKWGHISLNINAFSQSLDGWILWRPGPSYWYPENLRSVWSRGLESELRAAGRQGRWAWSGRLAQSLTRAQITQVSQARDLSLGKQLIYTPFHQMRLWLSLSRGAWSLSYAHQWTGRRYTASDNSAWLPPFDLGAAFLSWRPEQRAWGLSLRAENLWGEVYQAVENRAMPLQSLAISFEYFFQKS
jgi:iron complex outermembrane receptor protein